MTSGGKEKIASNFPYDHLQPCQSWRDVSRNTENPIDPHGQTQLRFDRQTKIASAGSCFAKRIAENLKAYGFNYVVTEPGPSWLTPEQRKNYHYGDYSARYGNIYTSLQLLQLMQRALGQLHPLDEYWMGPEGYLDPFRPRIQPQGFASLTDLKEDRETHLAAVKHLFETLDVFIFTIGLTETWCSRQDQVVFPMCPGRQYGQFDPERYAFRNLSVTENVDYLNQFLQLLKQLNPKAQVLLTVSPVPLAATLEERHVLQATFYSKSVLRVAVEEMRRQHPQVDYFASYELVMIPTNNAQYFSPGSRHLSAPGIEEVMRSLFQNFTHEDWQTLQKAPPKDEPGTEIAEEELCDEEELLAYIDADFRSFV